MQAISIPVDISPDIMLSLNENEQSLKEYCQVSIATMLFQEGKLTIGKAIQLSGLTRFEFEKNLAKRNITLANPSVDDVFADLEKLSDLS